LLSDVHAATLATRIGNAPSPVEILPDLEALRPSMVRLHSYNRGAAPISGHWGLYFGDRVAAYLDRLYYSRFRRAILDPAVKAMSDHFLQLQPSTPVSEDIYKELKTYRTITSGDCKADDALVASVMLPVWGDAVSGDPRSLNLADNQIQFYTSELKIADPYNHLITENSEAVQKARIYLQDLSGADKILRALLYQVRDIPAERLSVYASNYSQVLTGFDQVDGPYTRAGWNQVVESIRSHKLASNGEPCVIGGRNGVSNWTPIQRWIRRCRNSHGLLHPVLAAVSRNPSRDSFRQFQRCCAEAAYSSGQQQFAAPCSDLYDLGQHQRRLPAKPA
jgi:type VI protein secretion system component VasK